jgi:uncharacterized protein YjbI with pentapeptide repeats
MTELTRNEIFDLVNRPGPLRLRAIDLRKEDLSGSNLSIADLSGATMPDGTKQITKLT